MLPVESLKGYDLLPSGQKDDPLTNFILHLKCIFSFNLLEENMRAISILLMFFLVLTGAVNAASDRHERETGERIYLDMDQVSFNDSKIFVRINDEVFSVTAIFCDQKGYYVLAGKGRCQSWKWKCKNCGECVDYDYYTCPVCGRGTQDDFVPGILPGRHSN